MTLIDLNIQTKCKYTHIQTELDLVISQRNGISNIRELWGVV